MEKELTAMLPTLKEAQIATDALIEEIDAKLPGVEKEQKVVGAEAAEVQKEADACAAIGERRCS